MGVESLADALRVSFRRHASRPALLRFDGDLYLSAGVLSFKDVEQAANVIALDLAHSEGQAAIVVILIRGASTWASVVSMLACVLLGIPYIAIDTCEWSSGRELSHRLLAVSSALRDGHDDQTEYAAPIPVLCDGEDSFCAGHNLLRSSEDGCITEEDGGLFSIRCVRGLIARDTEALFCETAQELPSPSPDALLAVLFTSGSTGESKAILATARGALCRCRWRSFNEMVPEISPSAVGTGIAKTSVAFVDHNAEIFGPMLHGESLVVWDGVASTQKQAFGHPCRLQATCRWPTTPWRNPALVVRASVVFGVTRIVMVPSFLTAILKVLTASIDSRETFQFFYSLRELHVSGESLPLALAKLVFITRMSVLCRAGETQIEKFRIVNFYGSTEISGDVTAFELESLEGYDDGSLQASTSDSGGLDLVPVGRPLPRCDVNVFIKEQSKWRPAQPYEEGFIFVSGDHVARGYLDLRTATLPSTVTRSKLSDVMGFVHRGGKGHFIGMPPLRGGETCRVDYELIFATGDFGFVDDHGALHIRGRFDDIIKTKGQKVHLGKIKRSIAAAAESAELGNVVTAVCQPQIRAGMTELVAGIFLAKNASVDDTPSFIRMRSLQMIILRQLKSDFTAQLLSSGTLFTPTPVAVFFTRANAPTLPSGKVDLRLARRLLAKAITLGNAQVTDEDSFTSTSCAPQSRVEWEKFLLQLWCEILSTCSDSMDSLDVHSNFYEIGGDSLMVVTMLDKVRNHWVSWFGTDNEGLDSKRSFPENILLRFSPACERASKYSPGMVRARTREHHSSSFHRN